MKLPLTAAAVLGAAIASPAAGRAASLPAYVGSEACGSCHVEEAKAWSDSHHSWALRPPTPENVLGDFNDATITHKGLATRFFRKDGGYFVETDGADGKTSSFEIKYAVGVAPLQQYLVELDGGRLQALDIAWDANGKRWFHLYPNEDVSAGNGMHWTGPYKNWQARCAVCHQTDFRKNYDPKTRSYQSQWSELSLGCESCHGPGEAHVAWSGEPSQFDPGAFSDVDAKGIVRPAGTARQAIEENMCGPCHSRREPLDPNSPLPGSRFGDHHNLTPLLDGLYFPDGQQRDEVYILGSFLQSRMHKSGVTCSNCHEPHSGKLVATGNAVCTQCHNEIGRADFPTLKPGLFDSPAHHHHAPESAGAQCVNCHMPERKYMVVDGRRDHFFRVPDPFLSERVGSPDACRTCHASETAEWAAKHIAAWAPARSAPRSAYALALAGARREGANPQASEALISLARDASLAAVVRATAIRELGDGAANVAQSLPIAELLSDSSDLVRSAAARLSRQLPLAERVSVLAPLLTDPVRSVRLAAAIELAAVAPSDLQPPQRQALQAALDELSASFAARADFPETQMAGGGLAMMRRDWQAAEDSFSEAVRMDPQLVEGWLARARIKAALGDAAGAADILTAARAKNPSDAQVASELLGLLMRQGDDGRAASLLREMVAADPANSDLRATLAVSLLRQRRLTEAGAEIAALLELSPHDANALMLHALHQLLTGNIAGARETVREISNRYPGIRLPPQLDALRNLP